MANDRKSQLPIRQHSSTPERLASLEVTTDIIRADVQGVSETVEKVKDELEELAQSNALQSLKLENIEDRVEAVQSSQSGMEHKIITSVHNLLKIAKSTSELDQSLAETAKVFSKERLTQYQKIGGIIAMIAGMIWGFIQYVGIGNTFNRPTKTEQVEHLQGK